MIWWGWLWWWWWWCLSRRGCRGPLTTPADDNDVEDGVTRGTFHPEFLNHRFSFFCTTQWWEQMMGGTSFSSDDNQEDKEHDVNCGRPSRLSSSTSSSSAGIISNTKWSHIRCCDHQIRSDWHETWGDLVSFNFSSSFCIWLHHMTWFCISFHYFSSSSSSSTIHPFIHKCHSTQSIDVNILNFFGVSWGNTWGSLYPVDDESCRSLDQDLKKCWSELFTIKRHSIFCRIFLQDSLHLFKLLTHQQDSLSLSLPGWLL